MCSGGVDGSSETGRYVHRVGSKTLCHFATFKVVWFIRIAHTYTSQRIDIMTQRPNFQVKTSTVTFVSKSTVQFEAGQVRKV